MLIVARGVLGARDTSETRTGEREQLRADRARHEQIRVAEDRVIECGEIVLRDRIDFLLHERMATDRALAVYDHRAREDIRAFNRDADRHRVPCWRERVARAALDRTAGTDVHRIADDLTHRIGQVCLRDIADHCGFFAGIESATSERPRRGHQISHPGDARERFLDTFKTPDRRVELLAHGRIRTAEARRHLRRTDRQCGQRN